MLDSSVMEPDYLLRRNALESNGSAVGDRGFAVIDGFGDAERRAIMAIEQSLVSGTGWLRIGSPAPSTPRTAL
jgi:hypothetical protein